VKAHDLAHQLLEGADVPAVVPTYDDDDHEEHVEVRTSEPLPESDRWYDTTSSARHDPAIKLSTVDEDD
jgi:hypothetical protein